MLSWINRYLTHHPVIVHPHQQAAPSAVQEGTGVAPQVASEGRAQVLSWRMKLFSTANVLLPFSVSWNTDGIFSQV